MCYQLSFVFAFGVQYYSFHYIKHKKIDCDNHTEIVILILVDYYHTAHKFRLVSAVVEIEMAAMQ
jgi:hypothetical protein